MMTKDQIAQKRAQMAAELKALEEQEKNYEKKADGFKKIEELLKKHEEEVKALAAKYFITADEIKEMNKPKAVFTVTYKDSLGNLKTYDWYAGKIGKAPAEFEAKRVEGEMALMTIATSHGREYLKTAEGVEALKKLLAPRKQKKA